MRAYVKSEILYVRSCQLRPMPSLSLRCLGAALADFGLVDPDQHEARRRVVYRIRPPPTGGHRRPIGEPPRKSAQMGIGSRRPRASAVSSWSMGVHRPHVTLGSASGPGYGRPRRFLDTGVATAKRPSATRP
jgi:hypothetical protein